DLGIVLEFLSQQADLSWRRGRQGQRRQRRRVETGHVGHVVVIHKLGQITKFDAVFRAWVLVLVVKIFAVLGKADRGKALVVERGMVAAAQVAVAAEDQQRAELAEVVGRADFLYVAGQFARRRIVLAPGGADTPQIRLGGARGEALRENADHVRVPQCVAWR